MATFEFGAGADTLSLYFTQDQLGTEPARINAGILPNNEYVDTPAQYVPISAVEGSTPDVLVLKGDIPADSSFFFSFLNDDFAPPEDRNVQLVRAEINGNVISGASVEAFTSGDYGPFYYNGDAVPPEPEPEPVPGQLITGTGAANALTGGEGNDTISGLGGDDSLSGAGGDDVLRGGGGADLLDGGPGDDIISTGSGRDTVLFDPTEPGSDVVTDFQLGFDIVRIVGDVGDPVLEPVTTEGGGVGTRIGFEDYPNADMTVAGASNLVEATIIA